MKLQKLESVNIEAHLKKISEFFELSNKKYVCVSIDYKSLDIVTQEKFSDDGDFIPEWVLFILKIVTKIIKEKTDNIILTIDNSIKSKLKNQKFNTLTLRLDDFIDIGFKYITYNLGFFLVWEATNYNNSKITSFGGLITPIADGCSLICIANKNDSILEFLKNSC